MKVNSGNISSLLGLAKLGYNLVGEPRWMIRGNLICVPLAINTVPNGPGQHFLSSINFFVRPLLLVGLSDVVTGCHANIIINKLYSPVQLRFSEAQEGVAFKSFAMFSKTWVQTNIDCSGVRLSFYTY